VVQIAVCKHVTGIVEVHYCDLATGNYDAPEFDYLIIRMNNRFHRLLELELRGLTRQSRPSTETTG